MELSVMIVDDEKLERILIRKSFEWEEHGFKVVAEADSGESAMYGVKTYMPDIILTDINMPFMDGIAFSDWVKSYHPSCKIVMITGYREFEYAQKAIKIGVEDFLLKPINKKDIEEVIIKLKGDINRERSRDIEVSKLKVAYDASEAVLMESFLQRLVAGRIEESDSLQKMKLYKLEYLLEGCVCVNIKIDDQLEDMKSDINKQREAIHQTILNESLNSYKQNSFIHYIGNVIILFAVGKNEKIIVGSPFYQYIAELKRILNCKLNRSITIGIGEVEQGIQGIARSYNQSVRALAGRIIYGKDSLISYESFYKLSKADSNKTRIDLKEFPFCLENNLKDKAFIHIDEYTNSLKRRASVDLHQIHIRVANIMAVTLNVLDAKGKSFSDVFGTEQYIYDQASQLETIDEVNVFLKESITRVMVYLNSIRGKRVHKLIQEAQKIIDESIGDSTLTLKSLSAYLYVNDSYLSRTFKKELGESVIEYITRKRIEKSIEIFNTTDLKAYEVAEQVGINDPHYFGVCFKKYTGKTIKEFKQLI